jgi:hypothetical protein
VKRKFFIAVLLICVGCVSEAQVWQWSVSVDSVLSAETNAHPQAFLWIPENCKQVRGVVFTQHNMVEEGMLEHPLIRKTMTELGFAEVWVTPGINMPFDFTKDAGEDFIYMMKQLAEVSGYDELSYAPVVPLGHSAYATFPWNFAAWNSGRTLALVSVHGDAPQTPLTGYGRANVEWGNRNIDGVPALFVMGEFEWWEDRITPGFDYVSKHPNAPVSFFGDAGHGHFDYSDEMIAYVCMFIKKAAQARLPERAALYKPVVLRKVKPQEGWLMDRWRKDSLPLYNSASYKNYAGNRYYSSWCFDKEMADATEQFYANARGKIEQHIGFKQNGEVLQPNKSHANYNLSFVPLADGISFTLSAFFADTSRTIPVKEFAKTPLSIARICGPVKKINDSLFQLSFYRMGFNNPRRSNDIWLLASNKGDEKYKSAVQQLNMRFPLQNNEGMEQSISFSKIHDRKAGEKQLTLTAESNAHLPVSYYVKEGPAYVKGNSLIFTSIPPRAKYPVKVTVVAWQYGIAGKIKTAAPVERSFYLTKK